ncbi:ABC transporter permease [Bacillus sp. DTU_2020_1000418_1_SI_GHA_SEK_038]|uniref:nickel transporter permease n=1 Tax=Bacillus sp. DTU_2020_1000418_1_SI_GHA_SEK_038 TaxID=3077585 RepID=UPI0028E97832|nr:nickel transporter permease [Bacillus sp. DTU_2020_1000418_1_SI_GHA_SEK_038]WNS76688.1 ABC transporter permease [Bacillus sp. DTU_2020_1000418_1_SI_GHA_SEK_038]
MNQQPQLQPTAPAIPVKEYNPKAARAKAFYKKLAKNKAAMCGAFIVIAITFMAIFAPLLAPYDPAEMALSKKLQAPSSEHWLGTDDKGRDILSRILFGARISLTIGILSTALGAFAGILLGVVSGYYGRWIDSFIMRICDILLAFPGILLALAIISVLGASTTNVIIAVAFFAVPTFARIVRGSTLSVKKLEYIDAIRAMGSSDFRIIFKHILPNILSPIIVQATLYIASAIITASSLSFLGMGTKPPTPEWGFMLSQGRSYLAQAPHVTLIPGLAILLVVVGFNLFGDGLRDALDPKSKK